MMVTKYYFLPAIIMASSLLAGNAVARLAATDDRSLQPARRSLNLVAGGVSSLDGDVIPATYTYHMYHTVRGLCSNGVDPVLTEYKGQVCETLSDGTELILWESMETNEPSSDHDATECSWNANTKDANWKKSWTGECGVEPTRLSSEGFPLPTTVAGVQLQATRESDGCYTGTAEQVTASCTAHGAGCCSGDDACVSWAGISTVCPNSCVGITACKYLESPRVGHGSCTGDWEACYRATKTIGDNSCNAGYACKKNEKTTNGGSCNGRFACYGTTSTGEADEIASGSCNNNRACNEIRGGSIGAGSCNDEYSCKQAGDVGAGLCNKDWECANAKYAFTHDFEGKGVAFCQVN